MNHFHLLLGALPSLNGLKNYIQTEGGNGATIILVIFAIVFFFKQQIGKFFGFFDFCRCYLFCYWKSNFYYFSD
ncbi:hypothetical protein MFLO_04350 [Listeria floridensis FSL S10-1187]|uniref:Uncharacterized protein n=1 Tax=Listeria floridensis FSL S10-1187 TaxID=1265817 RepID=A0ABP3AZY0_9LIST|nr:hypothetical protein MFLO_04350 [Listeria floridensis FSL S10-1187]